MPSSSLRCKTALQWTRSQIKKNKIGKDLKVKQHSRVPSGSKSCLRRIYPDDCDHQFDFECCAKDWVLYEIYMELAGKISPNQFLLEKICSGEKTFEESIFLTENLSENFSKWEGGKGELFKLHSIAFYWTNIFL